MNIIRLIIEKHGQLDQAMIGELSSEFPNAQVLLQWSDGSRTAEKASKAQAIIAQSEKQLRSIQFNNASLECLCDALGVFHVPEINL
jgi:hypothetical protein